MGKSYTQKANKLIGKYAPIVLFVYIQPNHTCQIIEELRKIFLQIKVIYLDGPKNDSLVLRVNNIRKYLESINGFKSVTNQQNIV